ncbi:hypothetical protein ACFL0W_06855 [Nanoarchaeota archaeon]
MKLESIFIILVAIGLITGITLLAIDIKDITNSNAYAEFKATYEEIKQAIEKGDFEDPAKRQTTQTSKSKCFDSDGGINSDKAGYVEVETSYGRKLTHKDQCYWQAPEKNRKATGDHKDLVLEYFCDPKRNTWSRVDKRCTAGCLNGKCAASHLEVTKAMSELDKFYLKEGIRITLSKKDMFNIEVKKVDTENQTCSVSLGWYKPNETFTIKINETISFQNSKITLENINKPVGTMAQKTPSKYSTCTIIVE